jgi:hypothetical protein
MTAEHPPEQPFDSQWGFNSVSEDDLGGLDGARRDRRGRVRYTVARLNGYSAPSRHIPITNRAGKV